MMANKPQFDVLLGGSEDLPVVISLKKFVSARAQEIAALTQAIEDPQRTGMVFQKLPKHMRRRVMSRSSKRLPRRLREAHMHQLRKSGLPPKTKRPSRKYRRRPKNLLLEYNRRQKKFIWLETHIWHAKRFHMVEKWGYKLANLSNDKSFRSSYRATANHCLLQDISYYCCIELNGSEHQLLEHLQDLTSRDCGFTFGAKAFLKGTREGSVMLFHKNSYPFRAIGRVSFLWKPLLEADCEVKEDRTLWIWVHPAFYQEVLDELISSFAFVQKTCMPGQEVYPDVKSEPLSECPSSDNEDSEQCDSPVKKKAKVESNKKKKDVENIKLAVKNIQFARTPKYQNCDGSVEMVLLKDVLNRFRLTGPLSQAAVLESLHIADVLKEEENTESNKASGKNWWQEYYCTSENKSSWSYQKTLWENMKGAASPSQLPPHFILGLTVNDPRMQLPSKRTKATPDDEALWDQQSSEKLTELLPLACVSPIWNPRVRDLVTKSKLSTAELAEIRSHSLVPGCTLEELGMEIEDINDSTISEKIGQVNSCIPILLIQRPGCQDPAQKRIGYSSGWDIVMPAGWALPFWLGLIFRGARAGGLREINSVEFEANSEHLFPPDTEAGSKEAECHQAKLTEQHFRLPPDKRPNFLKLGISSPFICAWEVLISEWKHNSSVSHASQFKMNMGVSTSESFVLREKKKLESLKTAIESLKTKKVKCDSDINICDLPITNSDCCLVNVVVRMCGRGTPSDCAIICLPSVNDIDNILKNASFPGPVEELHKDENHEERRNVRNEHKKLLRSLRRKRVKEKLKQEDLNAEKIKSEGESDVERPVNAALSTKRKKNGPSPTKDIVDRNAEKMQSLWLPQTKNVRDSCSREVIGFVQKGDFSFTESRGIGRGYVVHSALLKLITLCQKSKETNKLIQPWILIRNPTSLQYRFGIIQVL